MKTLKEIIDLNQSRYRYDDYQDYSIAIIDNITEALLDNTTVDYNTLDDIFRQNYWNAKYFLSNVMHGCDLDEHHPFIRQLIKERLDRKVKFDTVDDFVAKKVHRTIDAPDTFIPFLKSVGATDEYILATAFESYYADENITERKSPIAQMLLSNTSKYGLLLNKMVQNNTVISNRHLILEFLMNYAPDKISNAQNYFVFKDNYNNHEVEFDLETIDKALDYGDRFEEDILAVLGGTKKLQPRFDLTRLLAEKRPEKFHDLFKEEGEKVLNNAAGHDYNMFNNAIEYLKYWCKKDPAICKQKTLEYAKKAKYINYYFNNFIDDSLGEDGIEIFPILMKDKDLGYYNSSYYYENLFGIISKYDFSAHLDSVMAFGVSQTGKINRTLASDCLAKYVDQVTPQALELLNGKVNDRIFGAMVLQHSTDADVLQQLTTLLDTERSDDPRDFIIEALREKKYGKPLSIEEIKEMIAKADARKKLNKWAEKWLKEDELPTLLWKDGNALDQKEMRFLFYRGKRSKGIELDIEAKQVIHQLDKDKAYTFAKYLIEKFKESNADNKYKHYPIMSALLGGDEILSQLISLFNFAMKNKRYQFAVKLVGSIALVGTDKALRFVEMLSRKYSNKRPQIGQRAVEVLDEAAKELNIDRDKLSDRIIPDFGFEDGYLSFMAGEDEYRAFINKDFVINYFNEDNKLRKSVPKETDKELKKELKEIQKEIKAVVKAQSGRLELYFVQERKWAAEKWQQYYLNNPIMFIYVQKLLWGIYSPEGTLKEIFYCDDDLELYNIEADEVSLDEDDKIGIVHPLHMTSEQREQWREWAYEENIDFEFEIINRAITTVPSDQFEEESYIGLDNTDIPRGADYVAGFLEKRGWTKSPSDGGSLEFYKMNRTLGILADAYIEGPAAYYQGGEVPAKVHNVEFRPIGKRDRMKLKEVPEVFFSEVIYDLKALIEA